MAKRLFVGLELPQVTRRLLARLDPEIRGARWTAEEQMHLTMSFLGEMDAVAEQRLRGALAQVRVAPFFLPVQGVGAFGGEHPTVLWAGVGRGHPHLFALHKHIQDAILGLGLEPDLRAFHPHITLARTKNLTRGEVKAFLMKFESTEFDFIHIRGFALFSSALSQEGAKYHVEMRIAF